MRRSNFLLLLVLFGLLHLSGCSGKELKGNKPPIPIVSVGEEIIEVVRASYCWNNGCVDYVGPPDILEGKLPHQVEKGEEIHIHFDFEPKPTSMSISRMFKEDEEWIKDEIINNALTVPNEEGIYYYDILAAWQSNNGSPSFGDSYYAFVIEVK